jgi:hypothetical protein
MKADFNFIPARNWSDWNVPVITFFGSSGHYLKMQVNPETDPTFYIIWDGCHVATKHISKVTFNPKHSTLLPRGFKTACKFIN